MLFDRFSRHHTYLRVSLTERCSLRCVYCMPEDGVDLTPSSRLLSTEETLRLARVFVGAGVTKIRLTGGEPTVRRDLPSIVSSLNDLRPYGLEQIAMTSNGIALPRMLPKLVLNGLDKLNLSLDTLDRDKFVKLTRRDGLKRVLEAIDLANGLQIAWAGAVWPRAAEIIKHTYTRGWAGATAFGRTLTRLLLLPMVPLTTDYYC